MSDIARKWSCEYCTYENWPASKKCILCRAPKPMQFIDEEALPAEQDIYKIAPLICSDSTPPDSGQSSSLPTDTSNSVHSSSTDTTAKWSCHMCTYFNWPRAVRCTQCLTVRSRQVSPTTALCHPVTQPLNVDVNSPPAASSSPSGHDSPSSPEAAKATNNDRNRPGALLSMSGSGHSSKWSCHSCTYDNWPRAQCCVLCGHHRIDRAGLSVAEKDTMPANRGGISVPRRRSPPTTASSRGSVESIEALYSSGSAIACPSSNQQQNERFVGTAVHEITATGGRAGAKMRQIRNRLRDIDWLWLTACQGVIDGDVHAVESYLAAGGDPTRQITAEESTLLGRTSAFAPGNSLVHLAIRFRREDILPTLLDANEIASGKSRKRVPSYAAPDVAAAIVREISSSLRQRKGEFPCYFLMEMATFALPADIQELPNPVKMQLFDELLDANAQKELEDGEEHVINWSVEIVDTLGSRLYALWNRTAGDCLLDSVLQASWGIMDRDNVLRRALADSLNEAGLLFYERWKETEATQAELLHFTLDDGQLEQDWAVLLSLANQPGSSLEQIHIFALSHILRRPIIVYGIKFVKNYHGDNIGLARFQGVYLPLLWQPTFCFRTPLALGYTRGHFSALVPMEVDLFAHLGARANIDNVEDAPTVYLPLMDNEGKVLPIHFLQSSQVGHEATLLHDWLDCCTTESGLLVAKQHLARPPQLVRQMVEEWLDRYRNLAEMVQTASAVAGCGSSVQRVPPPPALSSDSESDDE